MAMSLPGAFWVWGSPPGRQPRPGCRLTPGSLQLGQPDPSPRTVSSRWLCFPVHRAGKRVSPLLPRTPNRSRA